MKKVLKLLLLALAVILTLAVIAGGVFAVKGYEMYKAAFEETPLLDKIAAIRSTEGFTGYGQLPQIYIDAVLSVEDRRFFTHGGVDYLAILRALWNDLTSLSFAEGGSTITQQLMKNQYFTQDKTFERKFAEVFAAWELEKHCSKQEIFELYVNTIYFGSGYYGIHDAAMGYFGKTPDQLTDAEAVLLAGLPNAPSAYSPDENPDLAFQRMGQVVQKMQSCGKLTAEEAQQLLAQGAALLA